MAQQEDQIFIRESLRPDLRNFYATSEPDQPSVVLSGDPSHLLIRFSSCKESSTDGKEDTKTKEINKDDKGAAGSPSGPATDRGGISRLALEGSITESAHAHVFA